MVPATFFLVVMLADGGVGLSQPIRKPVIAKPDAGTTQVGSRLAGVVHSNAVQSLPAGRAAVTLYAQGKDGYCGTSGERDLIQLGKTLTSAKGSFEFDLGRQKVGSVPPASSLCVLAVATDGGRGWVRLPKDTRKEELESVRVAVSPIGTSLVFQVCSNGKCNDATASFKINSEVLEARVGYIGAAKMVGTAEGVEASVEMSEKLLAELKSQPTFWLKSPLSQPAKAHLMQLCDAKCSTVELDLRKAINTLKVGPPDNVLPRPKP